MNRVTLTLSESRNLSAELARLSRARVRVGILGNKADRFDINTSTTTTDKLNNPTLGLIHEFGTKTGKHPLPARSWLRMPLLTRLQDNIDKIGRAIWRRIVLRKGLLVALGDLGTIAVNTIDRAFETGGFGQWKKLSPVTIRRKGSSAILIDSAQLRKGVAYEVRQGGRP